MRHRTDKVGFRWMLLVWGCLSGLACQGDRVPGNRIPLASNRAYSGAPPVITHPVSELGRQRCLTCHLHGDAKGDKGKVAKRTPHPELEHCIQCHVTRNTNNLFRRTKFIGRSYPIGVRSQPAGPWAIPHPLTMRENCVVCHTSPQAHEAVRTTHPERQRCVQCHLPAYENWPGPRPGLDANKAAGGPMAEWSL